MEQVWAQAEGGDKLHLQKEEEEGPVSADRVVVGGAGGACGEPPRGAGPAVTALSWGPLPGFPGLWPLPAVCLGGTHLVVGTEAVHLLVEHSHPQVFAQELEDVQLFPEG